MKILDCIHALKALGEENRMRIVRMLMSQQRSVNEIAESLDISQYNVSKHLRILREAGLLETTKNGQQRLYSLTPDLVSHLADNNNILDLGCCTFHFDKLPG
ncbi:winged helix-turn-helix transcriptional regulator [Phragmitibacter flavus]|uniref:Winged helix-turn-helix transcriptional regulator n=1 Tax=Phragmitibacter flavus TaxID=2576071 RepID=A0A5R8KG50_9BACT|nr:metalloregulator ArsR/SmtB family transcription factor [Phragmitibacter flavus]TLD71266.1 winged helix-turn-helix transcriptional regulator [Phragmitibacter flavus]